jgi:hypothetical protein
VLQGINGDDSWELPVPATYVIARDCRVALAAIEVDYREPGARRHFGRTQNVAHGLTIANAGTHAKSR